jgi:ABC-2 type transport system permease protein
MNTEANALPESLEMRHAATRKASQVTAYFWTVRREIWENRSIYIAPSVAGAVGVIAFAISAVNLGSKLRAAALADAVHFHHTIQQPYDLIAGLMMLATMLVSFFYCVDCLYGERRDRSILFWKSLPVSDLTTVLAKMTIPLLVIPVIGSAVALVAQLLMLLISSLALSSSDIHVWEHVSLFRMWVLLLYHLVTVHALWWADLYGWLILVSAWARRAPILWATLPLAAIAIVEKIAFNTSYFLGLLQHRVMGQSYSVVLPGPNSFPTHPMTQMTPGRFVMNPELWIELTITAGFLMIAARLRRQNGPI